MTLSIPEYIIGTAAIVCGGLGLYGSYLEAHQHDAGDGSVVVEVASGHGSGVFIDPTHVLTVAHVTVEGEITVLVGSAAVPATVVYSDSKKDVSVLALSTGTSQDGYSSLACRAPVVGEAVSIKGAPLNLPLLATYGRVAALSYPYAEKLGDANTFVVDATIASGDSGGPVYDSDGGILGITDAVPIEDDLTGLTAVDVTSYGLIIPANDICNDLRQNGLSTLVN